MSISTHVLDTSLGKPAEGVQVVLQCVEASGATMNVSDGITNADGRIAALVPAGKKFARGNYRLTFAVAGYFEATGRKSFYPVVAIDFTVSDESHYHVPLLLNPFGYSTYRGS